MALIEAQNIIKTFKTGDEYLDVLKGVSLSIEQGEFVAIVGQSGSGKTTLMNILGCLDVPTTGVYQFDGRDTATLSAYELAHVRNKSIGFVFQQFFLLADLTALDNVALPLLYAGVDLHPARDRARTMLEKLELGDRLYHFPNQLSGGQQQRVSIARALMNDPMLILADEPTGNLDSQTGDSVMALFTQLYQQKRTVIIVTHDPDVAALTKRVILLKDGAVVSDTQNA